MDFFQSTLVLLGCFLFKVYGQDSTNPMPSFVSDMEIDSAFAGQTVTLRCKYKDAWSRTYVQWIKITKRIPLIITEGENVSSKMKENKYSLTKIIRDNIVTSELDIKGAQPNDEGTYRCIVRTDNIQLRLWPKKNGNLTLLAPPKISIHPQGDFYFKDDKISVHRGRDVKITCTALGDPAPNVVWLNENDVEITEISALTSDLLLNKVTPTDTGNYKCTADNGITEVVHRTIFVGVFNEPICNTPKMNNDDCIKQDDPELNIHYIVSGLPMPNITWFRRFSNGTKVTLASGNATDVDVSNSKYDLVESEFSSSDWNRHGFRLQVKNFSSLDFGEYGYEAINTVGSCSNTFNIRVSDLCGSDASNQGQTGFNWTSRPSLSKCLQLFSLMFLFLMHKP